MRVMLSAGIAILVMADPCAYAQQPAAPVLRGHTPGMTYTGMARSYACKSAEPPPGLQQAYVQYKVRECFPEQWVSLIYVRDTLVSITAPPDLQFNLEDASAKMITGGEPVLRYAWAQIAAEAMRTYGGVPDSVTVQKEAADTSTVSLTAHWRANAKRSWSLVLVITYGSAMGGFTVSRASLIDPCVTSVPWHKCSLVTRGR